MYDPLEDEERPSPRLLAQRLRNRLMEEMFGLAEGEEDLRRSGMAGEYIASFFDQFSDDGRPYSGQVLTAGEAEAVSAVHELMKLAANNYDPGQTVDDFIKTGWPKRVEPSADVALRLMLSRGRFREDIEEENPTGDDGWPWRDRYSR